MAHTNAQSFVEVGNYINRTELKKPFALHNTETCIAHTYRDKYIKLDNRKSVSNFIAIFFFRYTRMLRLKIRRGAHGNENPLE